jgi:hypothetical protein
MDNIMLKQLLGGKYKEMIHIEANSSAGGLLISWKHANFIAHAIGKQRNAATIDLQFKLDSSIIRITDIYDPSSGSNRHDFYNR